MSRASRAPPASGRGKSILIQLYRRSDEDICREMQAYFRDSNPSIGASSYKSHRAEKAARPHTNTWFMIKETTDGPKIFEMFSGITQDKPIHSRKGTNCVIVGSRLYDIGGRGTTAANNSTLSDQIRRLDTKRPGDGWKSEKLPFYCAHATVAVYGKFIYLFPYGCLLRPSKQPENPKPVSPWAFMYDTVEHRAHELQLPANCYFSEPPFCIPLEDHRGVVVPIQVGRGEMELYVHETYQNTWKPLRYVKSRVPNIHNLQHATSHGIFYVYKFGDLDVYEIRNWKHLGTIELPQLDYLDMEDGCNTFMVAVGDSEICFLWMGDGDNVGERLLHYAKFWISLESLEVTQVEQAEFPVSACGIANCLPYTSFYNDQDQVNDISGTTSNKRWSMRCCNKGELEEVDWKKRCMQLEEELQRIKEESQRVQKKLKR